MNQEKDSQETKKDLSETWDGFLSINSLLQGYEEVRKGRIKDSVLIRRIASGFAALARDRVASKNVSFDASRAASNLYHQAQRIEEKAKRQARHQITQHTDAIPKKSDSTQADAAINLEAPNVAFTSLVTPPRLSFEREEITRSQAQEYLKNPYPVWVQNSQGEIIATNLLMSWLWGTPQLNNLFGLTIFEIFYHHRHRIPESKNSEFLAKNILIARRLIGGYSYTAERFKPFIEYVTSYPDLKEIDESNLIPYENWYSESVWKYFLRIIPPKETISSELLNFQVSIYRILTTDRELLCAYEPYPSNKFTQALVEQKYKLATAITDMIEYVQYYDVKTYQIAEKRGGDLTIKKEQGSQKKPEQSYQPIKVEFADEYARMDYEIAEAIKGLNATLPSETREANGSYHLTPIRFDPEHDAKGEIALFYAHDFMNAKDIDESETIGRTPLSGEKGRSG